MEASAKLWWLLTGSGFWGLLSKVSACRSAAEAKTMLSGEVGAKLAATWLLPFSMPTCISGGGAAVTDTWAVVVKVVKVGLLLLLLMVVVAVAPSDVPRELLPDRLLELHTQGSKGLGTAFCCNLPGLHKSTCMLCFIPFSKFSSFIPFSQERTF